MAIGKLPGDIDCHRHCRRQCASSIPSGVAHLSRAMRPHSCTRAARRHVGRFCEITSSALDETQKMLARKRWGKAHDVGRAAVFLASDRADYITGQQLNVSGGYGW
ncbi:SDR family oxidoreductase [Burkholderia pyrrocinia]|uniref:SDR family oxidoreductase n=1 Tax=Burkholderia pyrrocinia TaxID=60550 RepID=UPI001FC88A80|nr:SDR family oxidoreductase [Burkholderia pyrrocinia]